MRHLYTILLVSLMGCFVVKAEIDEQLLQPFYIPESQKRLSLVAIENNSDQTLKFFYGAGQHRALLLPHTGATLDNPLFLNQHDPIRLLAITGDMQPVYIQDGDKASGTVPEGYHGPYYISMWVGYPQVPESAKLFVPYGIKKGKVGQIGILLDDQGDCQLKAHEDIVFI